MKTTPEKLNILILIFGLLLSAYARLLPTWLIGFPVTDGGLFYAMTRAIQDHRYTLPSFVEYNGLSIPFAYPPLGFYLASFTSKLFNIPLVEVFRWMPAIFSIAFTVAFYLLASSILGSRFKGSLATIFFALLPRSMTWYIMGGGITRAPGQLFLLLTLYSAYQLFTAPSKKYLWMTILFGCGVVLSHPEETLHAALLGGILWLFFGRSKEGMKNAFLAAICILILTAPFFLTVISRHGFEPYKNAAASGLYDPAAWITLLTGSFSDEKFVTVISALALLGLVVSIAKREYLLIVWLLLPALVDPRGAASISIIAWSMLASVGFSDVVIPGLYALENHSLPESDWPAYFLRSPLLKIALTALIFYSFFGAVASDQVYRKFSLTPPERTAMKWITDHIPAGSRFLVVTAGNQAFSDATSEWFPALTGSVSLATVQGYEWLAGKPFTTRMDEYDALQTCVNQTHTCIEQWASEAGTPFEYVLVSQDVPLSTSLSETSGYQLVHGESNVRVFKYLSSP